jgi:hypothetical protein
MVFDMVKANRLIAKSYPEQEGQIQKEEGIDYLKQNNK